LLQGESGTGKELLARAIHDAGNRCDKSFVGVNCNAIPEALFESEFFGHRKGAFTGATRDHPGLFCTAHTGTLFLDEIGDMPQVFQVKLLRALQERKVRPVGASEDIEVDVRVIAATHTDLYEAMEEGDFRKDLFYRLNVVTLNIPALAQRREDIPILASHFLKRLETQYGSRVKGFSPEALEMLMNYEWPGNVRQLHNVVEQSVALSTTPLVPVTLIQNALREEGRMMPSLREAREEFERDYLIRVLKMTQGNVSQAAKMAKRNRTEFYRLLNRHRLDSSLFKLN
jgi:two-component system, NtrC family, response regulator GlrR